MGLTLNQVKRRLESLGNTHRQIRTVKFVGYDETLDGVDLVYPALIIALQKDNKISLRERQTFFNFKVYLFDLINVAGASQANEYEVKSDLVSIAEDFVALVTAFEFQDSWVPGTEFNLSIADYQLQDLAGGVSFDLQIGILFDANRCQVPTNGDVVNETDNEMKIITNYIHDVVEASDELILTAMTNREIIMLWLGDKLLSPTSGVPTVNQYRYTADYDDSGVTKGRFEFGTDLQPADPGSGTPAQVVQILNRSL